MYALNHNMPNSIHDSTDDSSETITNDSVFEHEAMGDEIGTVFVEDHRLFLHLKPIRKRAVETSTETVKQFLVVPFKLLERCSVDVNDTCEGGRRMETITVLLPGE